MIIKNIKPTYSSGLSNDNFFSQKLQFKKQVLRVKMKILSKYRALFESKENFQN